MTTDGPVAVVSVTLEQIATATRIHDPHMPGWAASDATIGEWAVRLPNWDEVSALAQL